MENKVLAIVDGREIRESHLNDMMKNLGQNAAYFQGPEGRKNLIDELVMQELMYSDAVENNLEKEAEFIEVFDSMKKSMLQQYNVRKMFSSILASDEELRDYYEKNKENYNKPETIKASHILVDTVEKANDILEEMEKGLSFEDAASQYSSCPSKEQGGDLGQFGKGQMVKEFEDAAFLMDIDEISAPIKTQFGYHIIKLAGRIPAQSLEFEEAYQDVKNNFLMAKQQQVYLDKREELAKKYAIEILE